MPQFGVLQKKSPSQSLTCGRLSREAHGQFSGGLTAEALRPEGGSGQPITADCPQRARQCPLIRAQVPGSQNPSLLCLERSPRGQLSHSSALRFYHFLQKVSPRFPNCGSSRLRFVTKLRLFPTLLSSQSVF